MESPLAEAVCQRQGHLQPGFRTGGRWFDNENGDSRTYKISGSRLRAHAQWVGYRPHLPPVLRAGARNGEPGASDCRRFHPRQRPVLGRSRRSTWVDASYKAKKVVRMNVDLSYSIPVLPIRRSTSRSTCDSRAPRGPSRCVRRTSATIRRGGGHSHSGRSPVRGVQHSDDPPLQLQARHRPADLPHHPGAERWRDPLRLALNEGNDGVTTEPAAERCAETRTHLWALSWSEGWKPVDRQRARRRPWCQEYLLFAALILCAEPIPIVASHFRPCLGLLSDVQAPSRTWIDRPPTVTCHSPFLPGTSQPAELR